MRGSSRRTGGKHGPCSDGTAQPGSRDASDATGPTSAEREGGGAARACGAAPPAHSDGTRRTGEAARQGDESQNRRPIGSAGVTPSLSIFFSLPVHLAKLQPSHLLWVYVELRPTFQAHRR